MNAIHRACGISLLIVEEAPVRASARRPHREGAPLHTRARRRLGAAVRRVRRGPLSLTTPPVELDPGIETLSVRDASDPRVRATLREMGPDVLLAYGGSLLDEDVLGLAGTALNVHWGLAPWYRGLYTTAWALLGWDPHGIGITVHHMSPVIDGGPIAAQLPTPPRPGDDYAAILRRQREAAVDLTVACLDRITQGQALPAVDQDRGTGRLYTAEQWSPSLSTALVDLLADDGAARMIARPSRPGPLDIVRLDGA